MFSLQNVRPLKKNLTLKWRRGKDLSFGVKHAHAVVLNSNSNVYIGGGFAGSRNNERVVMEYNPKTEECNPLLTSNVCYFGMTSMNEQLILAGGGGNSDEIQVWDCFWLIDHYPRMPTGRSDPAAVSYQNYLIIACGGNCTDKAEILDCSKHQWYSAQSVPLGGRYMTTAIVGEYVFLSAYLWRDGQPHMFSAHLPTLISSATSSATCDATVPIWQELPPPPVHGPELLSLQNHLLLIGGQDKKKEIQSYDPEGKIWSPCGELPVGMSATSCAVLLTGELFVAGGAVDGVVGNSKQVWIATLE